MIGLMGIFMLGIGLTALGLTGAKRPSSYPIDIFVRLRQLEWVVAFLFIPLGMWMMRMTVVRFTKPKSEE